ncbi:MAG: CopG family transcriptional regulator [Gammaproteobacteria bacterium]|nr:CopG family transcriptional regulator [Gammaproteobacteria bacterium]
MHFNIYLDEQLGSQLTSWAKQQGVTRNSMIREAIKKLLESNANKWPDEILEFQGIADFPAFEESRKDFLDPREDPFK